MRDIRILDRVDMPRENMHAITDFARIERDSNRAILADRGVAARLGSGAILTVPDRHRWFHRLVHVLGDPSILIVAVFILHAEMMHGGPVVGLDRIAHDFDYSGKGLADK